MWLQLRPFSLPFASLPGSAAVVPLDLIGHALSLVGVSMPPLFLLPTNCNAGIVCQ